MTFKFRDTDFTMEQSAWGRGGRVAPETERSRMREDEKRRGMKEEEAGA